MNSLTITFRNRLVVWLLLAIITAIIIMTWPTTVDAQCSMCRAVVGSNLESGDGVQATGINNAILYLMATPYVLAMIVIYALFGDKIKAFVRHKMESVSGDNIS